MSTKTDPLLQPFTLRHLTLKNRIMSTPHEPAYAEDGMPKERYQLYHEEKAKGGIAMTMFGGSANVAADSPSVFGQLYVANDDVLPYFRQFADRIHQYDCALICQITHMGRRTVWNQGDWLPVVAPSRVREPAHRAFPKEMDKDDIRRIIKAYADGARRCKEGGLDGAEVLQHGHLLEQFFSPLTNTRTDEYGGSFDNRMRFTLEVLEQVREAVGPDFILGIRQGMNENRDGGIDLDEGAEAARIISETGLIDYMTVNFGKIATDHELAYHIPGMHYPLAPWVSAIGSIRKQIAVPVFHACKLADLSSARYALQDGLLDMAGMVRAHIADPHIVRKLEAGDEDNIRPCVGAGYCLDRIYEGGGTLCIHNPATGREATMPHVVSKSSGPTKKVVVVGAGPGGLEAARVSAERGHSVILFEATGEIGGQINLAARAGWRKDLIGIVDWYRQQIERLGVDVRWNTFADDETVKAEDPDIVIIATGGLPDTDYVPGGENCMSVWDVLSGEEISGEVLVYDDCGQHQGPSCADFLSTRDNTNVEFVTPDRSPAIEMGTVNFPIFLEHFYKNGVSITPDHRLKHVEKSGNKLKATFTNEYNGPEIERIVDHVVVEHGTLPFDEMFHEMRDSSRNNGTTDPDALAANTPQSDGDQAGDYLLYRVGDAISSRNIHAAIYDSLRLCKDF
ncbi:MAG: NADH:flavin oxidoreductase [Rhodospirillales bacterium]|mgnify:CR=1 FL=1|jgi:2,4-dienoyl-CoA reductase-like NADH-dependent reductase (Old Yellow Enzyme family)|nr:NADH:flavin oxidoreductase [Rhodospirillales bacterium]MBT4626819.1 NADH:flavin oxidoreductase [Rhodospirillales bacterium]MBT5521198.1 NADH:flavin oxidoreductase [Rhodospirillales bacterium]MBT6110298.1 NADH:flavin oxidoreductase [Rhodospirillales bacterium]MBT6826391.1 NADH:flavin oxidoreductase [Rhodospirillales bacterium]